MVECVECLNYMGTYYIRTTTNSTYLPDDYADVLARHVQAGEHTVRTLHAQRLFNRLLGRCVQTKRKRADIALHSLELLITPSSSTLVALSRQGDLPATPKVSSSWAEAVVLAPDMPVMRYSKSPSRCTELCLIRQLSSNNPVSSCTARR